MASKDASTSASSKVYHMTWMDLTKIGAPTTEKLNYVFALAEATEPADAENRYILGVACPTLVDGKTTKGVEGEKRKVYDKMEAKGYENMHVTLAGDKSAHGKNNRKCGNFSTYWGMKEYTTPGPDMGVKSFLSQHKDIANVFLTSEMLVNGGNLDKPTLLGPDGYVDPKTDLNGKAPRAYEGPRHWTPAQLSALQLSGTGLPIDIVKSLLTGTTVAEGSLLCIVNLTGYDGYFEMAMFLGQLEEQIKCRVAVFSLAMGKDEADFSINAMERAILRARQTMLHASFPTCFPLSTRSLDSHCRFVFV